jgi:Zn-dependent protease with chaperone function
VRGLLVIAVIMLAAPSIALVMLRAERGVELTKLTQAVAPPAEVCAAPGPQWSEICGRWRITRALLPAATAALAIPLVLPLVFGAVLQGLRRRRFLLARCFAVLVRAAVLLLAVALMVQGAVVLAAIALIDAVNPGTPEDVLPGLVMGGVFVLVMVGAGLLLAGALTLGQWRGLFAVSAVDVDGVILAPERLPDLTSRVARIATQLRAQPPTRIIVGLRPRAFVTAAGIRLRGSGLLPLEETLYLPLLALTVLSESELDGLIAHELGHFRGQDLNFTKRFVPALLAFSRVGESVVVEGRGSWFTFGRLPAQIALSLMLARFLKVSGAIRQQREFEADRAAAEVVAGAALIAAIAKLSLFSKWWPMFSRQYGVLAHQGTGRRNLVRDYLFINRVAVLTGDRRAYLAALLLKAQMAHPFDSHPALAQRARALNVDAAAVIAAALEELAQPDTGPGPLQNIEEEVTALETEFARRPGGTIVISDKPLPKPEGLPEFDPPAPKDLSSS